MIAMVQLLGPSLSALACFVWACRVCCLRPLVLFISSYVFVGLLEFAYLVCSFAYGLCG